MNIEGWNTGSGTRYPEPCEHIKQLFNNLVVLDLTIEAIDCEIAVKCGRCRDEVRRENRLP